MADLNYLVDEWPAISRRLDEALAVSPEQRDTWLDALHETDALKTTLRRLLADASGLETDNFLRALPRLTLDPQAAGEKTPAADACAGLVVGPYRLVHELGVGGMGTVWLAERVDGRLKRQVAVKLPRLSWARGLAERMGRERDILASLDHPNIARIHDAGLDERGRPYLALEYVAGEPIDAYCKRLSLALADRLELILQVARAVAHAHSRLVVHRDLKPANILVTPEGQVRLLDFGIAKLMEGELTPDTELTVQSGRALTPDYASPEQIRGEVIGTASDVYSLGVVAFELLAGARPYHLQAGDIGLAEAIAAVRVPRPSRVAADPALRRQLEGDLDAIVATCMHHDAADRYPTVDAFRHDLERHLGNEPVAARGRARLYVLGRALRRHRLGVGAALLVFATLASGLAATAWQARRAEVERDIARRSAAREEAVRYYLTNMFRSSITQRGGGSVTAKAMLDRSAQRVLSEYRGDPQLAGKVVVTLSDLYSALEDVEGQAPLLEGFLAAAGPEADREAIALVRQKLAHIELLRGHTKRAAELLPQAEAFWATAPERYREQHLEAASERGLLQRNQGDLAASARTYAQAIAERIAFSGRAHRETAGLYNSMAITLTGANRLDEALAAYRTALAIYAELGQSDDLDALVTRGNTGTLAFRTGRLREAEEILKSAYEKQRERAGESAAVAASMGLYGAALTAAGRHSEAIAVLEPALEMAAKFVGIASPLAFQNRLFLTDALTASGRFDEARQLGERNRALASERFGDAGVLTLRARVSQARLSLESGQAKAAQAEFEAVAQPLRGFGRPGQPSLAHALFGAGEALLAQGRAEAAIAPLRETMVLRKQLLWAEAWELAMAKVRLGEALKRSGTPGGAELLAEGSATLATQLGESHPQVARARRAMAAPA